MTTIFIAGSMGIKHLDPKVKARIDTIVTSGFDVVVGDADGADTSIQQYLLDLSNPRTTVFCSGRSPRNNVGNWPIRVAVSYTHLDVYKRQFMASHQSYGSRRLVTAMQNQGFQIGRHKVRSLMRKAALTPAWKRKFIHTTNSKHGLPVAANAVSYPHLDVYKRKLRGAP